MNKTIFPKLLTACILILLLNACSHNRSINILSTKTLTTISSAVTDASTLLVEYDLMEIPLPSELASANMEYSGLSWYGKYLILLPQYPNRISHDDEGFLYAINKDNLMAFLDNPTTEVLVDPIPFDDAGLSTQLVGFEGFEAIVFIEDSVYLTIETRGGNPMKAFIVKGVVASDENSITAIRLDPSSLVELTVQNNNSNASYEALTSDGKFIYAFFEQNGEAQNNHPYAIRLDSDLKNKEEIPVEFINYRVTDATLMDEDGSFWMINYFFPGDTHLAVSEDPISIKFGLTESHRENDPVERLVKFNIIQEDIVLADDPPLYLQLLENDEARNWEGLAAWDQTGFLLITDKFPDSILGYLKIK